MMSGEDGREDELGGWAGRMSVAGRMRRTMKRRKTTRSVVKQDYDRPENLLSPY